MATPSTLILASLILLGEKQIGGTLTAAEQTHWLARLNAMIDSWSIDRLMCYQLVQESLVLTAGTSSYTIGTGGAFNTDRPNKIVDPCFIRDSGNLDSPLQIISAESYGRIPQKTVGNTYPSYLFYDSAFVSSLGTIFLYPKPSASLTLFINSWKALQSFALISTTVVLPPGYQLAIESNFAIHAAAGFRDVPAEVRMIARDSKAAIMSLNVPDMMMKMPPGLVSSRGPNHSILTGP